LSIGCYFYSKVVADLDSTTVFVNKPRKVYRVQNEYQAEHIQSFIRVTKFSLSALVCVGFRK